MIVVGEKVTPISYTLSSIFKKVTELFFFIIPPKTSAWFLFLKIIFLIPLVEFRAITVKSI